MRLDFSQTRIIIRPGTTNMPASKEQLTSRFYERILNAEMDEYLGYKKHDNAGDHCGNSRNGYSEKTVILDDRGTRSMVSGYGRSKILGRCVDRNKKPRYRRYTDSLYGRTYRIS